MMLSELTTLFQSCPHEAGLDAYEKLIVGENVLAKPTESSRIKSLLHLKSLYDLDAGKALFRVLRSFSKADPQSLPLMAATCAYCRDPQLRSSFELIDSLKNGELLPRSTMEEHLERDFPGRFSPAMKKSLAQNVNTTWTHAGHLAGKSKKIRRVPACRPTAAAYAMFAGFLAGLRGQTLLESRFGRLVANDPSVLLGQLPLSAARGLIGFKFSGGVFEFDFRRLLTADEEKSLNVAA